MPSERGPAAAGPAATITALLLHQARRTPEAVAVRQWDRELTYAELVGRAAGLAAVLRDRGVGPEVLVGICVRRTPDLVVAVLGVLLAGGAYVPVDPDQPAARVRGLLDDAGVRVVVGDAEAATLTGRPAVPVPAEGDARDVGGVDAGPAQPGNAAYVMYTSGSTGRPKGVLVTHHSVVAWVTAFGALTGADAATRSFGFATLGFDASVADLFVPLAAGGSVALLTEADRADPARLQRFVEHHAVTWGFLTPALLPLLDPERLPAWSCLAVGGETVWAGEVERWTGDAAAPRRRFFHVYGTTETTVIVLAAEVAGHREGALPLGTPLAGHRIAVVDADLRPVPAGVPGELLVGGTGVARGYLGDPALTAERFVPDPDVPGARLYRTGDLVVRDHHGTLTYLRRLDRQVQLRGQRTEPGEVEAVLRAHPRLEQVAVEPVDGAAGIELVAFVAAPSDVTDDALRHWCEERLPRHMVPRLVRVATLPLGPTGKVDTATLRELALRTDRDVPRPADPVGSAWCDALGLATADPDDDFFASGGHSVAAMRLVAALRASTGRDVAIEDVFQARTLARLTARVQGAPELAEDLPTGSAPALSPPQQRLWFLDQLAPESTAYHVALVQRLRGPLDQAALRAALAAVAAKHDVLRWRFPTAEGVPAVAVDPIGSVPLPVTDLTGLPEAERDTALQAELHAHAGTRIDLARGPLWSARLFRTGADEHVLGLVVHHAVFDGWSQAPLFRDLGAAYAAARAGGPAALPPAPASVADYVAWRAHRDRRRSGDDLRWWTAHLAGAPTVLRIPHDRPRPPVQTYRGATAHGELGAATSAAVARLADRLATPPSTVLLAAFAELLRRVTGGTDVVIGTPAADRRHLAFGELVGFFVEVLPLRLRVDAGAAFSDLVRACGDEVLDVLAHPAAPLERIVDALRVPRDPATAPLVQVLFNVYNFPEPQLRLDGLECSPLRPTLPGSPFDLTTYVVRRGSTFAVDVLYNPDLFDARRIEALLAGYQGMVADLVAAPDTPVRAARLPGSAVLASGLVAPPVRPAGTPGGSPATAATTPTERAIAGVWREVLGRADIDATHNFFEVGGTSLAMTGVRARLHAVLGRDLRMVELFQHPSIRELAAYVDGATGAPEIDQVAQRVAARRGRAHRAAARRAVRRQHTDEPGGRA